MPDVPFTLCLCKGAERYILHFDYANRAEAMRTLDRWASNPELSFTWHNAAVMSNAIREAVTEHVEYQNSSKEATMPQPKSRISAVTRWPLDQQAAVERAQVELSALWFWKRLGFGYTPSMVTIQARAQEVLRKQGQDCQGK